MDTPPPAIEAAFEDETILERIVGLNEMFPDKLRTIVATTINNTKSIIKTIFSASRTITWVACSTAAILVLPISLESERQEYNQEMKRQERNIILGADTGPNI